jgi:hypothetical protein
MFQINLKTNKMKTKLAVLLALTLNCLSAQLDIKIEDLPKVKNPQPRTMYSTKKMVINGTYNGKSVFIQNSFGKNGIGFCISQINVNKNITTDEINAMFFKIDLEVHKLKAAEKFTMEIFYKDSCSSTGMPMIMNPGALMAKDPSGTNTLTVEGKNYNTNLIITNPRSSKGNYGVKEVLVNGKKVEGIAADVFEIPFFKMGIPFEQKIKIEFKYENDCDPFIVNPEVISW